MSRSYRFDPSSDYSYKKNKKNKKHGSKKRIGFKVKDDYKQKLAVFSRTADTAEIVEEIADNTDNVDNEESEVNV